MSTQEQVITANGKVSVTTANSATPRYVFDFGKLKRRDRVEFTKDIQKAINFEENNLTTDQADELALKWMIRLIVAWPDGYDLSKPDVFADLSAIEWKEASVAFMSQFRTVFSPEGQDS